MIGDGVTLRHVKRYALVKRRGALKKHCDSCNKLEIMCGYSNGAKYSTIKRITQIAQIDRE